VRRGKEDLVIRTLEASLVIFMLMPGASAAHAQTINALTAREKAEGWQLLFDGKTLDGWHSSPGTPGGGRAAPPPAPQPGTLPQVGSAPKPCVNGSARANVPAGGAHWEVVDGLLTACGEPAGYLTSDGSFKDFVLSIEFKTGEDTNSGVFVRSPQESGGYEVQIWRQQPAGYNTGAIVGTAKTAKDFKFKPDQWNHFQITADGDHLIVVLNGETTLDVHDSRFAEGNARLQYQQFPIAFRNIKIRALR
jgi:3-keto-disaccharide hydrolase